MQLEGEATRIRAGKATAPPPPGPPVWRQRVGAMSAVPALIRELGAEPAMVFAAVGLAPDSFDDPENRIEYPKLARLLHEAAEQTHTPHFGLLAGRASHLAALGVVGELVRHSRTLREALETLVAYQHLNSDGGLAFMWVRSGLVDLGYAIYRGGTVGSDQIYDATLAIATNFLRELLGPGWQPTQVLLPHREPADVRHYRSVFRIVPHFDCEYAAIRFPEGLLDRAVIGADHELRCRAEERIKRMAPADLLQRVYRTLRVQLLKGEGSGDSVAHALALHRRTLNRRLQDEGTTFQRCLDQIRFEVACQLLATSQISLDDIAATLGYASVSPFMRTFRRWSGTTPAHWRRRAGARGGTDVWRQGAAAMRDDGVG